MGAWTYISPQLATLVDPQIEIRVIARPDRASPATGFMDLFIAEQELIMNEALGAAIKEHGGKNVR